MAIIDEVFAPIYGKPSWQVRQGFGSFLTFEFGEPHLVIREPIHASSDATAKTRKHLAQRQVTIHGDWHLWLYLSDWRILSEGKWLAHSESTRQQIRKATSILDGQAIVRVSVTRRLLTTFEFDLGGRVEARPNTKAYGQDSDLWLLYEPSGLVFTLRADGQYSHAPGDGSADEQWHNLR